MASKYAMETIFQLIDKVSRPLDKIGIKSKTVTRKLQNDFIAAQKRLDNIGKGLVKWGKRIAKIGIGAIAAGIGVAAKQFTDFESSVTAASAKFKDVDVTSQDYKRTLQEIGKAARDVAAVTEFNANDTAGALEKMAMAGLTSEQSMSLLMGTTNLATAAGLDLTTAVDIATDALGAFNMMSDDTGILKGNLDRLSDVMAKTTNMFNTDMPQMFEAIKKGAPTFASAGQSVEDFSALTGALASAGIKGSEAGTQMRNMMLSLANPTGNAAQIMQQLGIRTQDAQGNYLNIIDVIGQFEEATKTMGSAEKAAALSTIFGSRTVSGMNILLAEGADKLRSYSTELQNAGGAAENIAEAMRGSLKNRIAVLSSAATELGFKFVEAFQEKGGNAIKSLTDWISSIDVTPIVKFASSAINAISAFAVIIGNLAKTAWKFRGVIIAIVAVTALYRGGMLAAAMAVKIHTGIQVAAKAGIALTTLAMKGQAVILAKLKAGTIAYNIVSKAFAIATKIATAAQWLFNAALTANPIGVVIVAVGALVAALALLAIKWDRVTQAVRNNGEKVLFVISIFTGPFGYVNSMVRELFNNWNSVVDAFRDGGILAAIKRIGAVLLSGILAPIQGLLEILSHIPRLGHLAGRGAERIAQLRNNLLGEGSEITANTRRARTEPPPVEPGLSSYERGLRATSTPVDMSETNIPNAGALNRSGGYSGPHAGRSNLHGVVDISGGYRSPVIPNHTSGNTSGAYAAELTV